MKKYRPHMPMKVKLQAALLALGLDPKAVQWDHAPALGLREYDEETRIYTPGANDPRYIVPRTIRAHALKTDGPPATSAGSDKNLIAKTRNGRPEKFIVNKPVLGAPVARRKPKGKKLQGRGFSKTHQPMRRDFKPNVRDIND